MQVLLTNDDGVQSPGIRALWESVRQAFDGQDMQIKVVAPDRQRSDCGHSVTNGRGLTVEEIEPDWFSVDGTPVDCVRVALGAIVTEPTMVIAGVNCGANLGVDLLSSGTYAAAREAAVQGIPAMAVSQYRRSDVVRVWHHAPKWLKTTLTEFRRKVAENSSEDLLWNVNLPAIDPDSDPPPRSWCRVDRCPIERQVRIEESNVRFDLDFHGRPREKGSDVDRCFSGSLTISELNPHT